MDEFIKCKIRINDKNGNDVSIKPQFKPSQLFENITVTYGDVKRTITNEELKEIEKK